MHTMCEKDRLLKNEGLVNWDRPRFKPHAGRKTKPAKAG
jgi:hypothetical protein